MKEKQIKLTISKDLTKGKATKAILVSEDKDCLNIKVFKSVQGVADHIGCNGDKLRKELRKSVYLTKGGKLISCASQLELKMD